jgi:TonB-dependent SusC/RagA subfamily outer membrane receptor
MKKLGLGFACPEAKSLIKYFLMIKFAVLFVFIFSIQSFGRGHAQGNITLNLSNVPIKQALKAIEAQAAYRFVFKESILANSHKISVRVENATLEETLEKILNNTYLTYKKLNKKLVVISAGSIEKGKASFELPVRGRVTNNNGEPLAGASVSVKGTNMGTTTDATGRFSLTVPDQNAVLVISFVGYLPQEIQVGNNADLAVLLELGNSTKVNEVIVVGYGTQRRKAITGSVSKVDLKNLQHTPATNISQALRGSVPGVQFQSNGRPGQGGNILIRGQRSITASNDPLIVLDGIIFSGSLNDISPNDVESMEVLQDASAGAIYGTRAANGVILITTRRGTTEKPTINFNTYYGVQDYAHKIEMNTPEQYIQTLLDYRTQSGHHTIV